MAEEIRIKAETPEDFERLTDLVRRTMKERPKAADVAELRRTLAADPDLWRDAGDLTCRAGEVLVAETNATVFVKESIRRGMVVRRRELGYAEASPLERLLIERIVLCGTALDLLQMVVTHKLAESHTFAAGAYWDRRLERAERRYVRVVEALARVRKLLAATSRQERRADASQEGGALFAKAVRSLPPAHEPASDAVPAKAAGDAGEGVLRRSPGLER